MPGQPSAVTPLRMGSAAIVGSQRISVATLAELGFAYMKMYGATKIAPEPGKPQGYEETGSVSRDIPGIGITAQSSTFSNHTYEMDADNLKEIGHKGFTVDAQAMAAALGAPLINSVVATPFDLSFPGMLTLPTAQQVTVDLPPGLDWRRGYEEYVASLRACCAACASRRSWRCRCW